MLERGKYGVEWTKRPEDRESSLLGRVVFVVILLSLVSLSWTLVKRLRQEKSEAVEEAAVERVLPPPATAPSKDAVVPAGLAPSATLPPPVASLEKRAPKVRNLLLRLQTAERSRDVEMAVSTIEQLRALPGSPVADIDDALARRLGDLNMHRLFSMKCAQWVATVTVKSGQSASRIAYEHGSTLASLVKLNGDRDVETIRPGQQLHVLNHPRFSLAVRRRTRTADLQLNGKFFKRYDLKDVTGEDGVYEVALPIRSFWKERGLVLDKETRAELELLLPKGASVMISEL